jgi:hypothetical protein
MYVRCRHKYNIKFGLNVKTEFWCSAEHSCESDTEILEGIHKGKKISLSIFDLAADKLQLCLVESLSSLKIVCQLP